MEPELGGAIETHLAEDGSLIARLLELFRQSSLGLSGESGVRRTVTPAECGN